MTNDNTEVNNANPFVKFLRGELGLKKTFWLYSVAAYFVVNIIFSGIIPALLNSLWTSESDGFSVFLFVTSLVIAQAYAIIAIIATWNASRVYAGPNHWKVLARLVIFLHAFLALGSLLNIFSALASI